MVVPTSPEQVLLYVPNLIGYVRVACMIGAFAVALTNYKLCVALYIVAFAGDAIDGMVARKLGQSSRYGSVLDMVTDRISTAGLLLILSHLYPKYMLVFLFLMLLDISSHWFHVASIAGGGHHKSEESLRKRSFILRSYYGIYPLFAYCCVGAEFFFILLYTLHFVGAGEGGDIVYALCFYGCLPGCVIKNFINLAQLASAAYNIAEEAVPDEHKKD